MEPRPSTAAAKIPLHAETFIDGDPPELRTAEVREGYRYWRAKCHEGALPSRDDIDPLEIPNLLPSLMFVDIDHGVAPRFRCRLAGDRHTTILGENPVGSYLDQVASISNDPGNIIDLFTTVARDGIPHYWIRRYIDPAVRWGYYERILLPLARDARNTDMLLSIVMPFARLDK